MEARCDLVGIHGAPESTHKGDQLSAIWVFAVRHPYKKSVPIRVLQTKIDNQVLVCFRDLAKSFIDTDYIKPMPRLNTLDREGAEKVVAYKTISSFYGSVDVVRCVWPAAISFLGESPPQYSNFLTISGVTALSKCCPTAKMFLDAYQSDHRRYSPYMPNGANDVPCIITLALERVFSCISAPQSQKVEEIFDSFQHVRCGAQRMKRIKELCAVFISVANADSKDIITLFAICTCADTFFLTHSQIQRNMLKALLIK